MFNPYPAGNESGKAFTTSIVPVLLAILYSLTRFYTVSRPISSSHLGIPKMIMNISKT